MNQEETTPSVEQQSLAQTISKTTATKTQRQQSSGVKTPGSRQARKTAVKTAPQTDGEVKVANGRTQAPRPAKKKTATKNKASVIAPTTPSFDEVSAFISSLKKEKSQTRGPVLQVSEPDGEYVQPAGADQAGSSDTANAEDHGAQPTISRREKRRLEWIEKRRQWRDQKKIERVQRRTERDSDEQTPDEAGHVANTDASNPVQQQPAPQSKEKKAEPVSHDNHVAESTQTHEPRNKNSRGKRGRSQTSASKADASQQEKPADVGSEPMTNAKSSAKTVEQVKTSSQDKGKVTETKDSTTAKTVQSPQGADQRGKKQPQGKKSTNATSAVDSTKKTETGPKTETGSKDKKKEKTEKPQPIQVKDEAPPPLPEAKRLVNPPKHYFVYKDITAKPELSDAVARIVERVEEYMHTEFLAEDGSSLLVCVSGGVDSIVMLDILHILSFEHAYTLTVVHVNHGLRGDDAKRDEKFVRALALKYDLQCHATQVKVDEFAKKHSLSQEEAARELRYKFFRQTASTVRANFCATAHNADDAAETLLMNLFRGTGLTGLASIPPRRALIKKTQLIRPLLILSKQEILEYATLRELEWYEDETNTLTKYTRNKVRHDLLPKLKEEYNPKIIESLNRTASLLRKADGFIDSLMHATYQSTVEEREDSCLLDVHRLEALHSFVQGEIAERAISYLTFGRTVSFASIDRVLSLIQKKAGTRETIVNNLVALREREHIVLMYEQHLQEVFLTIFKLGNYSIGKFNINLEECFRNDVRIGQSRMVEYLDYDKLPYRLTLRTWHHGDTFHPIGLEGHVKVSDLLTNEKVEHAERQNALVLATSTDIVWVCGLRMSEDFKITNDTRRIIRATFTKS